MARAIIETGQEIYVTVTSWSGGESTPQPYIIEKVTTVSFHAYRRDDEKKRTIRFDMRKLTHSSFGYHYMAYLKESDYWNKIRLQKEKGALSSAIKSKVDDMSLKELQKTAEFLGMKLPKGEIPNG